MGRGRPKGAKTVDRVPVLSKDAEAQAIEKRKHTTFDEDEDVQVDEDVEQSRHTSTKRVTRAAGKNSKVVVQNREEVESEEEDEDEGSPEEITASSDHIKLLKEQYQQSLSSSSKKNKRKKRLAKNFEDALTTANSDEDSDGDDEMDALDADTLAAITSKGSDGDDDEEATDERDPLSRIDVNPRSKAIGRLQVEALEGTALNPLEHFKLAPEIEAFEKKKFDGVHRVRYTTFISQRRVGPAKRFRR